MKAGVWELCAGVGCALAPHPSPHTSLRWSQIHAAHLVLQQAHSTLGQQGLIGFLNGQGQVSVKELNRALENKSLGIRNYRKPVLQIHT